MNDMQNPYDTVEAQLRRLRDELEVVRKRLDTLEELMDVDGEPVDNFDEEDP